LPILLARRSSASASMAGPFGPPVPDCWPGSAKSTAGEAYQGAIGLEADSAVRRFLQQRRDALRH
jgi:hypothetical protein